MITNYGIKRKFLVRQADLQDADDLNLQVINLVYLDPAKIEGLDLDSMLGNVGTDSDLPVEIQVASVLSKNNEERYFAISKVGERSLVRAEAVTEIDSHTFNTVKESLAHKELKKSRFSFSYLRKKFDLDVINDGDVLILGVNLESGNELFAVPPFVNVIKEVTDDESYYSYNLAAQVGEKV